MSLRIGIDARELCGHPTGVGRYLRGLLDEWASTDQGRRHEFVLYAAEHFDTGLDLRRFATRVIAGPGDTWWEQVRLPSVAARDHLDVFFAPAYSAPLALRVPVVVAMHDVSFAAHPEWFSLREGLRRRWLSRRAAEKARAIVTISEFSRRELLEHLGADQARVHVVPPGVTAPLPPANAPPAGARVLYVGSIFTRRHVPDLIRAFAAVARAHPEASMDLVGDNRTHPRLNLERAIALDGLDGRVHWRAYVADPALAALYGTARVFAFLSEYEGLGLTPLEALAAGVPPLLLDTEVARESCGDAATYVRAGDTTATSRALEQLLYDEAPRARIMAAAPAVLARYSWPRAARDTLALIERSA
jgi:glycosyltransferase involved in cell wall biosynthesis